MALRNFRIKDLALGTDKMRWMRVSYIDDFGKALPADLPFFEVKEFLSRAGVNEQDRSRILDDVLQHGSVGLNVELEDSELEPLIRLLS